MTPELEEKIFNLQRLQGRLREELFLLETYIGTTQESVDSLNVSIKEFTSQNMAIPQDVPRKAPQGVPEDIGSQMEQLLQGSLDTLGDKISDKLVKKMEELKPLSGRIKIEKMKEIKNLADEELVDLSSLFLNAEVESNIEDVGVDEQEATSIDKNLKKLSEMRKKKKEK